MLRAACRRPWASLSKSLADHSIVPPLRNSSGDQSYRGLGVGFIGGPSVRSARTFVVAGMPNNLFSCVASETIQCGNNALPKFGSRHGSLPPHFNQVRGFIQLKTNLEVADNSGARRVQCIKVMKGSNAAQIGDIIMASVKEAQPRGKVKKGDVVTCVVVRAATQKLRRDGSEIRFDKNAVVIVNKQGEPIGTRIFGTVPHELRRRKLVKILTLAEHVV